MSFDNCSVIGIDMAFCDVCWTAPPIPPIPVVYVIAGFRCMAANPSCHIFIWGGGVHNSLTLIPVVFGDEMGTCGGVVSGTHNGWDLSITFSCKCLVDGGFVTRWLDLCLMNSGNCIGLTLVPCQLKTMTLS